MFPREIYRKKNPKLFLLSSLNCNQMWLNLLVDDPRPITYLKDLERKKQKKAVE
jgi:hypothetical protein